MSLAGDRQEIAEALSAVEGVRGHKFRPTTLKKGDAWPLLTDLDRAGAKNFTSTWRIVVILPSGEKAAMDWFDEHHELIADGLEDTGFVETIEPATVATEVGLLEAMLITLRREA